MRYLFESKFVRREAMTFLSLALLIAPGILGGNLLAQAYAPQHVATGSERPHKRADVDAVAKQRETGSEADGAHSPSAAAPIMPADQPPNPAIVRWESRSLEIEASNSSLAQILHQVAAKTGAKLVGTVEDQRIFGTYGPGPGCEVLSKLLEGSGYNVLISSSPDSGTPLEIALSARSPVRPQMAAIHQNRRDSEASQPPEPERRPDDSLGASSPQPSQDPFNIGGAPRDQAQMMQEIQQRQHVIDQQQQQQQDQQIIRTSN